MATPYRPIVSPTAVNPIGFNNTGDPRKATQNNRSIIAGQGDVLQANAGDLANQYRDQTQGTQDYLHAIEDPLAHGEGGYNPTESTAINWSPQEQQNLITGAGISAGTGTAASVAAAERAAAAMGGSPMALAAYRQRAARQEGQQAGDAMTQARVAAKTAAAGGAKTTGDARLGQQGQALGYYGNLQGQQNQNSQNEQVLQQQAYGTQTAGTNAATGQVLSASQTPSTFDKVTGLVSGALGAVSHLADGDFGDGMDAVLGEDGPEAIVETASNPDPPREFMADGGWMQNLGRGLKDYLARRPDQPVTPASPMSWNKATPYAQLGSAIGGLVNRNMPPRTPMAAAAPVAPSVAGSAPAPDADYGDAGQMFAADGIAGSPYRAMRPLMMADGGFPPDGPDLPKPPKIVTSPTNVHLDKGDSVVPLSYRPNAKVRPSMAMKAFMPRMHHNYGGLRA